MLLTSKLAARFFAAFLEEFVEDPCQAAALSDDGCTQLFERHPPTENANSVFFGKDGKPVARLEAIFFPDGSGEDDSATFTENYRFSHDLPPNCNYGIFLDLWQLLENVAYPAQ
jgi:hypothetical protein